MMKPKIMIFGIDEDAKSRIIEQADKLGLGQAAFCRMVLKKYLEGCNAN